jgi:hypothetical protein
MTSCGLRWGSGMLSADSTRSVFILSPIDQSTTRRLHTDDHGQVQEPRPGWHLGHVGHPELIGVPSLELALDQVVVE